MINALPIDRLAATLAHFAWQGVVIALVTHALMTLARRPSARYAIGCAGLVAMLASPLITFALLADRPTLTEVPEIKVIESMPLTTPAPAIAFRAIGESSPTVIVPTFHDRLDALAPFAVAAWGVGVAILGARHAIGLFGVARLRRRAVRNGDTALGARLTAIASVLGIKRPIALLLSVDLDAPAVIGWLRPAILWPASLMTGLTPSQLDGLFAHELAHIQRHDYLVNLLQSLVEMLGFYHPAVWWLSDRVRQEREHCCDEIAATIVGDRSIYAGTLAQLESLRCERFVLASNGGSLLKRVQCLLALSAPRARSGHVWRVVLPVLVLIGMTVAMCVALRTKTKVEPSPTASTQPAGAATTRAADYAISPGDLLRISVFDLTGPGVETMLIKRVANSGIITLPYVDEVAIGGLSEAAAEGKIRVLYREKQILSEPVLTVLVVEGADGRRVSPDFFTTKSSARETPTTPSEAAAARDPLFAQMLKERDLQALSLAQLQQVQGAEAPLVVKLREQIVNSDKKLAEFTEQLESSRFEYAPAIGAYYVSGAISRPGAYARDVERISVVQALISAGCNLNSAVGVHIFRRWPDAARETELAFTVNLVTGKGSDVEVRPRDTIVVGPATADVSPATHPTTAPASPR